MPEKKRILILTTSYLPLIGGSELAIKNITDRLPEYDFDIITARLEGKFPIQEKIGNAHVFRLGNYLSFFEFLLPKNFLPLVLFWKARQMMRLRKYELVHAYQASQAGGAVWLLKFLYPRIPFILTMQEGKNLGHQPLIMRMFRRLIINRADSITVISTYLKKYILHRRQDALVDVIPNGVDIRTFCEAVPAETVASLRQRLGIAPEEKVIISSSRFVEKNGLTYLIQALKHLPQAKLVLVGSGDQEQHLRTLADVLSMSSRVVFPGSIPQEELPTYLRMADVFVRPSLSEGLGTAFLEAMACGVPVVASSVGGIPDFLADRQTGLFCNPTDPFDIAEKIKILLEDQSLRDAIVRRASEIIRERYTWDTVAQAMGHVYRRHITA